MLESYGAGNAPTNPEFLAALKEATDRGVIIVNVSQCGGFNVLLDLTAGLRGVTEAAYATGRALKDCGVILYRPHFLESSHFSGADMTTEAALTKLAVLIPIEPDRERLVRRFEMSTRGEVPLILQFSYFHS